MISKELQTDPELKNFQSKMEVDKKAKDNFVGLFSVLYKVQNRLDKQKLENKKLEILQVKN